jgi:hypothetical protein
MMNRRTWIGTAAGGLTAFLFAAFAPSKRAQAASHRLDAGTLIYTLRVGRPEDEAFIGRVVAMMNAGDLPRSILQKCYLWAKKKRKHKFHYFKRALILLAAKKGIVVK